MVAHPGQTGRGPIWVLNSFRSGKHRQVGFQCVFWSQNRGEIAGVRARWDSLLIIGLVVSIILLFGESGGARVHTGSFSLSGRLNGNNGPFGVSVHMGSSPGDRKAFQERGSANRTYSKPRALPTVESRVTETSSPGRS